MESCKRQRASCAALAEEISRQASAASLIAVAPDRKKVGKAHREFIASGRIGQSHRSPAAAFALLLIAIMRFLAPLFRRSKPAVNRTYVLVTILVVLASIRAVEATLKLIGRFALSEKADG